MNSKEILKIFFFIYKYVSFSSSKQLFLEFRVTEINSQVDEPLVSLVKHILIVIFHKTVIEELNLSTKRLV